ncbi:putative pentatricopeptide repeat domain-containing protein [Daldinia childiae]|uniref:putative pentatricopeptide repeat domain-containing protein n=1 Tax=Daldinia childiae TaxID=326645 RepID=UPI0014461451|nr:putative pentatricopeptide repeat domain-containing protein [Daldinia childiae]KAF3055989.1 putative pentatricopeptide repeat domain-containing protein [Daldinia childiae]
MRLVSKTLRDVKPKRFVLHPRFPLSLQRPQLHGYGIRLPAPELGNNSRYYFSASSSNNSESPFDVLLSELSDKVQVTQKAPTQQQKPTFPPIQETKLFGKWRALLTDPYRLSVESDFDRRGPAKEWHSKLLVDKFENRNDLALWSALLDYQKRVNGDLGVWGVWKGLWGRKSLYDVQNPLAPAFWQTMLEAAVKSRENKFLTSVWVYSEWMYEMHGVKWPHLYSTVLSHFLRTHQHHQALQWQLRLTPNFYPGADEFANIIKQFANDQELYRTPILESLYIINSNRQLYDILVPYLYDLGASRLAAQWRRTCVRHDDLPLAHVSARPFLRFLKGYFPHVPLHPEESAVIDNLNFESKEDAEKIEISREFMNRVHGGTFGISVKNYNDRLGAKWLASSWVSLNTAISTISALGIGEIGPLSLQSIALREGTSKGVLKRIEQLREQGISVIESNYLRLVLYLAKMNDNELLLDLLHSDLHPDVFDDAELQSHLVVSTANSEDWRTHRLMLATRLAVMDKSTRQTANALAETYILHKDRAGLSKLLDDMKAMEITLDSNQTSLIFDSLISEAKSTFLPEDSLYFYLPICRQLAAMEIPVPIDCWRKILFCLARQSRVDDLEKLSIELADMFTSFQSSRPGFAPVHPEDIPESMKKPLSGVENLLGVYVPLDLPIQAPLHPLRQIFDNKLLGTIVRYSFYSSPKQSNEITPMQGHRQRYLKSGGGRAVRLLRSLYDRGVLIEKTHLVALIKLRLITFYGPGYPTRRGWQVARANNSLTLKEMKSCLDEAWGEELLPPLERLQEEIETRGRKLMIRDKQYLQSMGRTVPQLRIVL